jgi:alpha-1,6-mannosyltransferase
LPLLTRRRLILSASLLLVSALVLAISQARLGSPLFLLVALGLCTSQALILPAVWHAPADRRWLRIVIGVAIACRVPLAVGPVNFDSDMVRYVWDGRVQRFGYNVYDVLPSDPGLAHTHTADTVRMPSRNVRTPYPPAAQFFFRGMVTLTDSPRVMKVVLTFCDVMTMFWLWWWLRITGRNEWLVLTYAWSPLVILEVAHSGHIDALGTFWIVGAAYCMARRRTALAAVAYTLAVATKLLPLVLAPLFVGRLRLRDMAIGGAVLAALYLPFTGASGPPLGAVPNVVTYIRFNSPIFRPLAWVATPSGAAAFALLVGLGAALWARLKLDIDDPAAWAWPMALALVCAPVIYPWYLLYFTPFLFTRATVPLLAWTYSVIPVYLVWERSLHGSRWIVPTELMIVEFGVVVAAMILVWRSWRGQRYESPPASISAVVGGRSRL